MSLHNMNHNLFLFVFGGGALKNKSIKGGLPSSRSRYLGIWPFGGCAREMHIPFFAPAQAS